jgi:hypothetical protein
VSRRRRRSTARRDTLPGMFGWLRAAFAVPAPLPPTIGLASPFSDPGILSRITLDSLFPGLDPEAWPLTRDQAMTVPAVAAAYSRIVGTLSRLPLVPLDSAGRSWSGPAGLLTQPDPGMPHTTTMRDTLSDVLFHGVGYWGVTATYQTDSRPLDAVYVPVGEVDTDDAGRQTVSAGYLDWLNRARGLAVLMGGAHLLRFDGPIPGGLLGIGQPTLRTAARFERAVLTAADNPVPSVELHQTTDDSLSDPEILAMIRQWEDARRGHGVGYTNAAIELKTHGQQPEQLLISGRNQQAVDVARLAGIPAASIDAAIPGASLTYANLVDRLRDLINLGLQNYAAPFCARLSMDDVTPHGVSVAFDYDELFPPTSAPVEVPSTVSPAITPAPATSEVSP